MDTSKHKNADLDQLVLMHDILKIFATEAYSSNDPVENEISHHLHNGIDKLNDQINELILSGFDSDYIKTECNYIGNDAETRAILCRIFTRLNFKEGCDELGLPL